MKIIDTILILIAVTLLTSCEKKAKESVSDKLENNNVATSTIENIKLLSQKDEQKKKLTKEERRKQIDEQNRIDSLRLNKVLEDALKVANKNIGKNKFKKTYEVSPDSIPVNVQLNLDYHFTKENPHLIIRRTEPGAIYIDIYAKDDNEFKKVVSHEQWSMTYVDDTIRDINGDGQNDFVVNWYGSTGCCLKAFSNVYLLRNDKKVFSENFEFINPTFSPKEQIIRGVCYGHPGQTEIYKYKWNKEKVDTLEYVSFERNEKGKTGKILVTTYRPYLGNFKTLKLLNSVPVEYKKIKGYDWFTGNGYE